MRSFRFVLGFVVYSFTIAVVVTALTFWWAAGEFQKPGPLAETKIVEIENGSGLRAIGAKLTEQGAIDNPYIFVFGTMVLGAQKDMKAGEYEVPAHASARDIMFMIRDGKIFARRVIIPEGLTSFEIINIINKVADLKGDAPTLPAEGSLLPQAYDYKLDETKQQVVADMESAMTKTINELWDGRAPNLPFSTKQEAITLASIVEKETGISSERKRVAGVFINRLKQGIALQTDPTVIYAITNGKPQNEGKGPLGRRLLSKDLEFDSPYNTYQHPGLPPGPIANPGRASIEAVLHPEDHTFIYFVANGTGGHVFASTLAEHEENVAKWRQIRREKENND